MAAHRRFSAPIWAEARLTGKQRLILWFDERLETFGDDNLQIIHPLGIGAADIRGEANRNAAIFSVHRLGGIGFSLFKQIGAGAEHIILGCGLSPAGKAFPIKRAAIRRVKQCTRSGGIGEQTRKRMGNQLWSRRVKSLIQELYPMIVWDKLYIGGGNAQRISKSALKSFDYKVLIIPNSAGVAGGVKAWDLRG